MKRNFVHVIQFIFVAIIFTFVGGALSSTAKADSVNLSDASYTVPVTLLKSGSTSQSMANHFFLTRLLKSQFLTEHTRRF
nr:hypothetical protein [Lentilactobacillus otakiensis]